MNTLNLLLSDGIILEAVEFGNNADFTLISRLQGQRKHRINSLTIGQMKMIFAAMQEQGQILMDAIDELYEQGRDQYDVKFRGKRIRIELNNLFGKAYLLSNPKEYTRAA